MRMRGGGTGFQWDGPCRMQRRKGPEFLVTTDSVDNGRERRASPKRGKLAESSFNCFRGTAQAPDPNHSLEP
jgi:hypothetical protein